jgi:diguanylate cyclase (GGDEF)-like protein/PAS domain S-box-containing protein
MRLIDNLFSQGNGPAWMHRAAGGTAYLIQFSLTALAYYVLAVISLSFAVKPGIASPLWLPSAIALCACLVWGLRMAPAVLVAAALGAWTAGQTPWPALVNGIGCSLEAVAATVLVQRFYERRLDFIYHQNVFKFVGITAISSAVAASLGTWSILLANPMQTDAVGVGWLTWWLGDASGMLIGVPLMLAWAADTRFQWNAERTLEAIAFTFLLPTFTNIAFGDVTGHWALSYLPIPFVIWAAFRFDLVAVTWTTAAICVITVWNTAQGQGPFAGSDLNVSLLLLMVYVCILGTMGLALASLLHQRDEAERSLTAERDELELRVRERTDALRADIEKRKRVEQQLAARERQLAEALHLAQIGSWNWEAASNQLTWSDEMYRIHGESRETFNVTTEGAIALIHPDDIEMLKKTIEESSKSGKPFRIEHRVVTPSGRTKTFSSHGNVVLDREGRLVRLFGTVQDITEARQAEAAVREAEERYRMVVELSPDAILVQQDGVFVFANNAACKLLHAGSIQQINGKPLLDVVHPDFHDVSRARMAALKRGEALPSVEKKLIRVDGSVVDVEASSSAFLHRGRFASLYIMRDITERKKTVEQMAYLAHFDSLTGLPNRMLFHQRLEHALSVAERPGRTLEILFLDLDRFKNINDTLGHATGDIVLQETAVRLQNILRESDTVARLGGDEFVVLVENVDEPHRGGTIAEKILLGFEPPFLRDRTPLTISTSIGISSFPGDGTDAETLLKKADIAMYRAKEMGRNNYRYYSAEMNLHTAERLTLEYALSHAIEQGQLSLYYQPKVDVLTNRISGMEALLRWNHPTLGMVPPQRFIPVAEETGLIRPIGYWAIRTACEQNRAWQQRSAARLRVAVNLSPRQLSDDHLIDNIQAILDESGLESRYLELEITESAVMAHPDKAIVTLNTLRDMGISVAIDDFGIGYSSLAYLQRFPIRAVKIDQSFVQGITDNAGDAAITRAIISLAHSLECSVIAEGAETQQQYDFLRDHDCDSVQGYYFSEPMNAEQFGDLIRMQSNLHLH